MEVEQRRRQLLHSPMQHGLDPVRPASAGQPRPPSAGLGGRQARPTSASSRATSSVMRRVRTNSPQFLCNADEEDTILPRPLPTGMAYAASYTTFDELVDKQILQQDEEDKVRIGMADVSQLYHCKCDDQGLQPNRERESRFVQLLSRNCRGIHFALRENGLGAKSAACIASMLAENSHFAVLDLSGNRLKDAGAARIAELLSINDSLVHVALKSNDIGYLGAEKLAEALQCNVTLTSLDLSGLSGINRNHLGTYGAQAMGNALAANRTLAALNLGANGLGNEGLSFLAAGLEYNQTLTDLNLSSNNLGWEAYTVIGPLLNSAHICSLDLERNDARDKGIAALSQSLKMPSPVSERLEVLNLSYNGIRSAGFQCVSSIIRSVKSLKVLKLEGNECGDAFGELAMAVKDSRSITHLTLSRCELVAEDGESLGEMVRAQTSLTRLDLPDNLLRDEGTAFLMKALKSNDVLRHLDLANNKIRDSGGMAIAEMLQENNSLQHLIIRQNNLKISGDNVAEALRTNSSLLELDFSYNDFSFRSYTAVGQHLQKNMKLWRKQATPRLMQQIDALKVDEGTLHGTHEEIVQEIKRREVTQENLSHKREHVKQLIHSFSGNIKKLEEEHAHIAMKRAKEEEAMAAFGDDLQRDKQKQENARRRLEGKIKSEEERINRIRKDQHRIDAEVKALQERSLVELAPQRAELEREQALQKKAESRAKALAEVLSRAELRVKELEKKTGAGAAAATGKDRKPSSVPPVGGKVSIGRPSSATRGKRVSAARPK